MSDEDDIDDQADPDDDFYDDDAADFSGTIDEALETNFQRRNSRQMLEDILERKRLRESIDDVFGLDL